MVLRPLLEGYIDRCQDNSGVLRESKQMADPCSLQQKIKMQRVQAGLWI